MNFDLRRVPFSRFGSYIVFSHQPRRREMKEGLYLRNVRGDAKKTETFRLELVRKGRPVPFREAASPSVLRLEAKGGAVELCIAEPEVVRARGTGGLGLRLVMETGTYSNALPRGGGQWQVNSWSGRIFYMLTPLAGRLAVDAPWGVGQCKRVIADFVPDESRGTFEGAIEEFTAVWNERSYKASFSQCARAVDQDYRRFAARLPKVAPRLAAAAGEAGYIMWSCVVRAGGLLRRPGMVMSKNWMHNVWSWDHCFNAMALAYGHPDLAWDQLMVMFDGQDETGLLPDSINNIQLVWNFTKPPVHGWTLNWMMRHTKAVDQAKLKAIYEPLSRWTHFWLEHRDDDGDGVPQYMHGNDSGWDNSTVFDAGGNVEAPDLSAYLVLQMDALAEIAGRLGRKVEAYSWRTHADVLLSRLIEHAWRKDRFISPRSGDHHLVEDSDSLMAFMPLVLGNRLPASVFHTLVQALKKGGLLTRHGLATENPASRYYEPDGYWRGPIWAPVTLLIADGLTRGGEKALAREIAARFCRMAAKQGMTENFDAVTGKGLRDPAYTWTASVFLVLAHEYV